VKRRRFVPYVILLIVALVWLFLRQEIFGYLEAVTRETFQVMPYMLYSYLIYLADGLLLGAFLIVGRKISVNPPVLIAVFLPSLIAGVITVLSLTYPPMAEWHNDLFQSPFVYQLIGVSLLAGLFSGRR